MKEKRKLYTSEKVLYIIFGSFWIVGFVFAVLGMFAYNYGKLTTNSLYALQKSFASFFHINGVMDFRLWGSLLMALMMVCFIITVFAYQRKEEKEKNAERRRQERLKILEEADIETK